MAEGDSAEKKSSPIKMKPLRDPGQSLQGRLDDHLYDKVLSWALIALLSVVWAGLEWYFYLLKIPRSPILFSLCAVAVVWIAVIKIRKARSEAAQLRQGIEGERYVGQFLESLRADGYQVLHDIEEDGYNIDHVLIGPTGVFAIETKTVSKPDNRDAEILYDGEKIEVDGHLPDRDPLKQAEAEAKRVQEIIQQRTGQKVPVRPVVLYPGWFVRRRCRSPKIWVVNENHLQAWLDHEPMSLSDADVQRYASVLADHVRSKERTRFS